MNKREEFENSPRFRGMNFTRVANHPDHYESPYANGAWDGWQAAAAEMDAAKSVIKGSIKALFQTNPNSYVTAWLEKRLIIAKNLGVYHGATVGNIDELQQAWGDFLDAEEATQK